MQLRDTGRIRGRAAGRAARSTLNQCVNEHEVFVRTLFPDLGDFDLRAAWIACDRERLQCQPDYARFPEAQGLLERHIGEREGFREATGCDEAAAAFHFSSEWFWTKRLNSRYVARWDLLTKAAGCTNVFIPDGRDGVTISDNRDIPLRTDRYAFRDWRPNHFDLDGQGELNWRQGAVSSGILLDEEPPCSFPIDPTELMPDDCRDDISSIIEFMERYRDFWGPCKQIWVDRKLRAVGVEKANRRMAILPADSRTGAVAVTACSCVAPELQPFRDECFHRAARAKGESPDENADWQYVVGGDLRQRRLTELTFAEAARGATLWGTLEIAADHAIPYPARVCLAGEKIGGERDPKENWSVTQHAAVLTGPRRRMLYRSIADMANPQPVYDYFPRLQLGAGVAMASAWQAEIESGRCRPAQDSKENR